jgi:hypothetical protein
MVDSVGGPHVVRVKRISGNEECCLLIMDSFSGHRTAAVKDTLERHGIDLCIILSDQAPASPFTRQRQATT